MSMQFKVFLLIQAAIVASAYIYKTVESQSSNRLFHSSKSGGPEFSRSARAVAPTVVPRDEPVQDTDIGLR